MTDRIPEKHPLSKAMGKIEDPQPVGIGKPWIEPDDLAAALEAGSSLYAVTARIINTLTDHKVAAGAELVNDLLTAVLDVPIYHDFARAAVQEAAHQEKRWGVDHDAGKTDADWFWLFGHLIGKILHGADNTREKKLHRIITIASVAANWHAHELGKSKMRPGIEPPAETRERLATFLDDQRTARGEPLPLARQKP